MTANYEHTQMHLVGYPIDEKLALETDELVNSGHVEHAGCGKCRSTRGQRRNAFVKGGVVALVVMLITIVSFLAMVVVCPEMGGVSLLKRQNSGSSDSNNAFVQHKYYIIVACVVGMVFFDVANGRCCSTFDSWDLFVGVLLSGFFPKSYMLSMLYARLLRMSRYITPVTSLIPGCLECLACGLCCEGISQI